MRKHQVENNDELIYDMWQKNLPPDETAQSIYVLSKMTWKFLFARNDDYFITSDNPVFFFPWMGIGKQESEVTFPISSHIALWATWRDEDEDSLTPRRQFVREINRRTASIATKYLFSPYPEAWIQTYADKKLRLNRIV